MAGITEVSAALAAAAVFRCSCCMSVLAVAASSRSLMARYRRARARTLRTRSVTDSRIIAAIIAAMSRKVMEFHRSLEWDQGQSHSMRAQPGRRAGSLARVVGWAVVRPHAMNVAAWRTLGVCAGLSAAAWPGGCLAWCLRVQRHGDLRRPCRALCLRVRADRS